MEICKEIFFTSSIEDLAESRYKNVAIGLQGMKVLIHYFFIKK